MRSQYTMILIIGATKKGPYFRDLREYTVRDRNICNRRSMMSSIPGAPPLHIAGCHSASTARGRLRHGPRQAAARTAAGLAVWWDAGLSASQECSSWWGWNETTAAVGVCMNWAAPHLRKLPCSFVSAVPQSGLLNLLWNTGENACMVA